MGETESMLRQMSEKFADDRAYRIADHFAEDYVRGWGTPTFQAPDEYIFDEDHNSVDDMTKECICHLEWRGIASVRRVDDFHIIVHFTEQL